MIRKHSFVDPDLVDKVSRNPALVRATVVGTVALVSSVAGRQFEVPWIDPLMDLYALAVVPVMGWWVQKKILDAPLTGKHAVKNDER